MRHKRRVQMIVAAAIAAWVGVFVPGASSVAAQGDAASDGVVMIPANTILRGEEGDVIELGRLPVDTSRAGPLCTWTATVTNQASVHPGSDILVESNGTTLVLGDVEATSNKVTTNSGSVSLASEVVISARLGPDGRFSGRMELSISYSSCGPTTTTEPVSTSTTQAVTTTEGTLTPTSADSTPPASTPPASTPPTEAPTSAAPTETTSVSTPLTTGPAGPEISAEEPVASIDSTAVPTTEEAGGVTTTIAGTAVLPVTGSGSAMRWFGIGVAVLFAGSLLVLSARRRSP